ncbi:MAG TPA: thioredoxin-dependent thiol peroxidase [Candidatus Methanoperedens sp.]|nr:thioredoxin-dependent thiol peroxidase [Candidatus Methanoperedens sp.]
MKAKKFELNDQEGVVRKLSDYKGKWVLLYFYPKDDTPGCTIEACSLRDNFHLLEKLGVQILGVSKDSVNSHKKFAEKYHINFPILSDESLETIKNYGAWGIKKFMGREYEGIKRMSFLINENQEIVKVYENVNPTKHAGEILGDLEKIKG